MDQYAAWKAKKARARRNPTLWWYEREFKKARERDQGPAWQRRLVIRERRRKRREQVERERTETSLQASR